MVFDRTKDVDRRKGLLDTATTLSYDKCLAGDRYKSLSSLLPTRRYNFVT